MNTSLVQYKQQFLPLQTHLAKHGIKDKKKIEIDYPTVLLSKISELDRNLVQRLEMAEIFDTDDFLAVENEVMAYLGMGEDEFADIKKTIIQTTMQHADIPKIILDVPKNHAFLSIASDQNSNCLAVLWSGLLRMWTASKAEGWHLIKFPFDEYYDKMNRPELIGAYTTYEGFPLWLDQVADISTYVSGFHLTDSISSRAHNYGFPTSPTPTNATQKAHITTLQLSYIMNLATQNNDIDKHSVDHQSLPLNS